MNGAFPEPQFCRPCRGFLRYCLLTHGLRRGLESGRRYRGCNTPLAGRPDVRNVNRNAQPPLDAVCEHLYL